MGRQDLKFEGVQDFADVLLSENTDPDFEAHLQEQQQRLAAS